MDVFTGLGVTVPVLAAPMAGGPSTPALVEAAGRAGSLGFLAGGYRSAAQLDEQIEAVRATTAAFGVNLFVPNPVGIAAADYAAYAGALRPLADRFGVELPPDAVDDDDDWAAKIALLRDHPVPVASFTFALPDRNEVSALQRQGTVVVQSVTSVAEARAAHELGVDVLAVQAAIAGGHSATFTPRVRPEPIRLPQLVATIRDAVPLPIIAAGGLGDPADVVAARHAGATAVMVGTALLRATQSGTSAVHRAALARPDGPDTVITHAFTGRPARGIRNGFIDRFDAIAPLGYPAIHHLTSGLRRAAGAAGDEQTVHLWAGAGYRQARETTAERIIADLAGQL